MTAAALSSIAVTPLTATVGLGQSQTFVATATYSDGSTGNVSSSVTWSSSPSGVVTFSGAVAQKVVSRATGQRKQPMSAQERKSCLIPSRAHPFPMT